MAKDPHRRLSSFEPPRAFPPLRFSVHGRGKAKVGEARKPAESLVTCEAVTSHDLSLSSLCLPLLLAMWRTISRAAQEGLRPAIPPTPSLGFWSKFREFRETERGITVECLAKNLGAAVAVWGLIMVTSKFSHCLPKLCMLNSFDTCWIRFEVELYVRLAKLLHNWRSSMLNGRVNGIGIFMVEYLLVPLSFCEQGSHERPGFCEADEGGNGAFRYEKSPVKMRRAMEILESEAGSNYCSTWQNICFCGHG
ncbi:cupin 2 conserved barrel domain protein, partial [Striga asiatica]